MRRRTTSSACWTGLDIDGPVAYDWEMHDSTYRVYGTTPEMATACAVAFCERIKEAGLYPHGLCGGTYVSYMKYDQGALSEYLSWYPEYKGSYVREAVPLADLSHGLLAVLQQLHGGRHQRSGGHEYPVCPAVSSLTAG